MPKIAQKALRGALSGPSPKSTPVNGGRDRKGSRHDRNCHDRRNRQNRQNRHGCLVVLYFVGQATGGQGVLHNRQNRQNRQNRHEGYPP